MYNLHNLLSGRTTRALLAVLVSVACSSGQAEASALPAVRVPAAGNVRRLDVLIVLYTRSFSQALTREQVERVHEEVLEFVDFYRTAAGDAVDFRISLLQVDRKLALAEVSEVAPGRYYLARADIEAELTALGMLGYEFDEVIALYAWNNANPEGASLAYGGGAVGPDGKFLGDAGYNSIGVFAWDPGRISQIMIHEVLHNIDDMFSMSDMPDAFLNADEMSRNMPALLEERPGAFMPQYDDDEMLTYARRELANRATYPWSMQLVYYGWMLQRPSREAWMKLRYGRTAVLERSRDPRPLYDRIFLSRADQDVYFPVIGAGARPLTARVPGGESVALERRTYRHTDFDGRVLFEGNYRAGWVGLPEGPERLELAVGDATSEVVRSRIGELVAPARVVVYAGPAALAQDEAVMEPGQDEGALLVEVREARLGGGGPVVEAVALAATLDDEALTLEQVEPGRFIARLSGLGIGRHRVTLSAEAPGMVFVPRVVDVERRHAWSIHADSEIVAGIGTPFDVTVRITRDRGVTGAQVTAEVAGREIELRELADGRYSVILDERLAPGLDTIRVRAELPVENGTQVLEREIPLYIEPRGWIEVAPRIGLASGATVTLEARARDRMGRIVKGAQLPLAVIIGSDLVMMRERVDGSGVYEVRFEPPPGEHRIYVISLEGSYERRVVVLQVRSR